MAEGFLRALGGGRFEAASAGTEARGVHPLAVRVMADAGVDISGQTSKTLERYLDEPFDLVITVCDDAAEACPHFPNARERRHWSFPDPSRVAGDEGTRLAAFREVRDDVRARVEEIVRSSPRGPHGSLSGG
jgi:arsenate reductase